MIERREICHRLSLIRNNSRLSMIPTIMVIRSIILRRNVLVCSHMMVPIHKSRRLLSMIPIEVMVMGRLLLLLVTPIKVILVPATKGSMIERGIIILGLGTILNLLLLEDRTIALVPLLLTHQTAAMMGNITMVVAIVVVITIISIVPQEVSR